jgi:nitrogen PTS system EIIA component
MPIVHGTHRKPVASAGAAGRVERLILMRLAAPPLARDGGAGDFRQLCRQVRFKASVCANGAAVLLSELLSPGHIKVPLGSRNKDEILQELVSLVANGRADGEAEAILAAVREREQVLSTGIGGGVAIPHGKSPHVDQLRLAAGVTRAPVDFDALDGQPVQLFFLLVGPESASGAHVKTLSRISRLLRRDQLRQELVRAASAEEFLRIIAASETA